MNGVTILLPAYNAATFIGDTIKSCLHQTYSNFELLIIDDGSKDDTVNIIKSFTDQRIRLIQHHTNKGLIVTLNEGIQLATFEYIARLDADDLMLPDRLAMQTDYLNAHLQAAVVASTIQCIDEENQILPYWELDHIAISQERIKYLMIRENCIAHPSVLYRKSIIQEYLYDPIQLHCEDYGLWLELLADHHQIHKIKTPLTQYRIHQHSITSTHLRTQNPFWKQYQCKKQFLKKRFQLGKWGKFESQILWSTFKDGIMSSAKHLKNKFR